MLVLLPFHLIAHYDNISLGKIVNIKETQIHQIVYGPSMLNQDIRPFSKETMACLASLKSGPVPGFDAASLGLSSTATQATKHFLTLNLGEKRKSEPWPSNAKRQKYES